MQILSLIATGIPHNSLPLLAGFDRLISFNSLACFSAYSSVTVINALSEDSTLLIRNKQAFTTSDGDILLSEYNDNNLAAVKVCSSIFHSPPNVGGTRK